jgi:hypothetical protein
MTWIEMLCAVWGWDRHRANLALALAMSPDYKRVGYIWGMANDLASGVDVEAGGFVVRDEAAFQRAVVELRRRFVGAP